MSKPKMKSGFKQEEKSKCPIIVPEKSEFKPKRKAFFTLRFSQNDSNIGRFA